MSGGWHPRFFFVPILPDYSFPSRRIARALEEAIKEVRGNTGLLATVLKEKTGQGVADHAVLIPMGMGFEKGPHAAKQHLRHLGLQGDALSRRASTVGGAASISRTPAFRPPRE